MDNAYSVFRYISPAKQLSLSLENEDYDEITGNFWLDNNWISQTIDSFFIEDPFFYLTKFSCPGIFLQARCELSLYNIKHRKAMEVVTLFSHQIAVDEYLSSNYYLLYDGDNEAPV